MPQRASCVTGSLCKCNRGFIKVLSFNFQREDRGRWKEKHQRADEHDGRTRME